ncbi:hypothetical protein [Ureibacillus aquaedulcis]|uniref:Uncharacterized protein n=1 Tax=Ureibacillus aquaedulcis TaxID=3058421 RepID=A0ABT8GTW7_9BACL|nr:hypothetical protein [Ureibacillus sp. BA0131]MDN4494336.1 hypothetical protein [Ureibacillus sp. BA0131]
MNKNKLFGYVLSSALTLGVIGGYSTQAFAAMESTTNSSAAVEQASNVKASLDSDTKQKMQAIMDELKTNLAELGVDLPTKGNKDGRGDFLANLDDATKEKAQAILDQQKAGTITQEEAQTQLAALGVDLPSRGNKGGRGDFLADLDDATKEKAQAILDEQKAGTITQEEAQTQLASLGVDLPSKGNKGGHGDFLADLDDATQEKAQSILDQQKAGTITQADAQTQLAELGVDLPTKKSKGSREDFLADLDDATKEKAETLIDEAEAALAELGIEHLPFKALGSTTEE